MAGRPQGVITMSLSSPAAVRPIVRRTRGDGHGPITRLMSPSDLGQVLKPFVFLDMFDADRKRVQVMADMPVDPHSGVATVTVPVEGRFSAFMMRITGRALSVTVALNGCAPEVASGMARNSLQIPTSHVFLDSSSGCLSPQIRRLHRR